MAAAGGAMSFHPEVLQGPQPRVLGQLSPLVSLRHFYLGGGTALACHLGHRFTVDLVWFTSERIADSLRLAQDLRDGGAPFVTGSFERGTLHGMMNDVRLSFIEYRYPLVEPLVLWPEFGCHLASVSDLACMKLSAVAQRGSKKDFVDIYAIGTTMFSLREMLSMYRRKYSVKDISHVLYGLAYFDDADKERGLQILWNIDWTAVKNAVREWVREVAE